MTAPESTARAGRWAQVFAAPRVRHDDPRHERSMKCSFGRLAQAPVVDLPDGGADTLAHAARRLLAR